MPHHTTFMAEEDQEEDHLGGDLESLDEIDVNVLRGDEEAHSSEDDVEDFTFAEKFSGIALGRDLLQDEHRCYEKCRNCPCPYCCGVTTHSWCGFCLSKKGEKTACVDDLGWYAKNCV